MNITKKEDISKVFEKKKPDIVIHTAANTDVDGCETNRKSAWETNTKGTKNIAEACKKADAKLIYISTDYVFDGQKGRYTENDTPNPINYYGITKLEGERCASSICKNCIIARTSVLYGLHPTKQNFVTWVIKSLNENKKISIADDHTNSPTLADKLAGMLIELTKSDFSGVIHTAGDTRIDRFSFAKEIANTFGLNTDLIEPIKMINIPAWTAKRPMDSSLNTEKIRMMMKTKMDTISENLNFLKKQYHEKGL